MPIFSSLALFVIVVLDEVWGIWSRLLARDCISDLDRKGMRLACASGPPFPQPILVDRLRRVMYAVLETILRLVAPMARADNSFECI